MEIRHFYCKEFMTIVGELGPVEIELIYTVIFLFSGTVCGGEAFERSLMEVTGSGYEILSLIKVKYLIAVLTIFLEILFSWDNLKESMNINPKETLRLMTPVFIITGISYFSSWLPSFTNETVIVYFLYQMVFAKIILKLMLFNMSGRGFGVYNVQYVYLLIPIFAYTVLGVTAESEMIITRICMMSALFEFLFTIYRLSKQITTH